MRFRNLGATRSVRPGYWFVPKRIGWGAVPVTWQGWMTTLAFVGVAAAIGNLAQHRSAIWAALLLPVVLGSVWLSWAKTDGAWGWRQGRDDR